MKDFGLWIKGRGFPILFYCLIFLVVWGTLLLYGVQREPVYLSFGVCLAIAGFGAVRDFAQFRRSRRAIRYCIDNSQRDFREIPPSRDAVEESYMELINCLNEENGRLRANNAVGREEMDDYYTLWAHQIKTPISAMRLLLQGSEGVIYGQAVSELEDEVFRVEQYVELAMNYQRLTGDGSDFVIKRQSLDKIVRQAVRKYAKQFIRKGLAMNYMDIDAAVVTDEKWLGFVVEQILSNALKYTKTGGVLIYQRGEASLVIEDTGIGIAPEDLPRIFEKGYTGYNGRTDKKSTGIGLYLCRKILYKLGHTVTAESEPGRGTRIILNLESQPLVVE